MVCVLRATQVKREVGDVSILINNAGIVTGKKFMDAPDSLIEKTMEVNTMGHFWVSQPHQRRDSDKLKSEHTFFSY